MRRFFQNPFAIILILIMLYDVVCGGRYANPKEWLMNTLLILPGVLIGLSFHEFAHAFTAWKCGDQTPMLQGRVTVNPFAHIDPMGLIALLFIGFGWGKPVEIDPFQFKKARRDELLVALAGVTMNLFLAVLFTALWRLLAEFCLDFMVTSFGEIVSQVIFNTIYMNLVLMVFNLLPIPPLDGFNVITQIFCLRETRLYYEIYNKGFLILMVLILLNVTGKILSPAVSWCYQTLLSVFFGI